MSARLLRLTARVPASQDRSRPPLHRWVAVTAAALLTLAACSNTDSSGAAGGGHNAADVSFATQMIPHHAQAVEMADLALKQARSQDVRDLAQQIQGAQQPEIDTMTGWLSDWDEPVPDVGSGAMDGMDGMDGSGEMPGMMSATEMRDLSQASGAAFERLWLSMMVQHHRGAIEMARTELSDGESPDVKALARGIISGQEKEIATMTQLLDA